MGASGEKLEVVVVQDSGVGKQLVSELGLHPPVPPACPAPLRRLLLWCWAPDPAARPPFELILQALGELQAEGTATGAELPVPFPPEVEAALDAEAL